MLDVRVCFSRCHKFVANNRKRGLCSCNGEGGRASGGTLAKISVTEGSATTTPRVNVVGRVKSCDVARRPLSFFSFSWTGLRVKQCKQNVSHVRSLGSVGTPGSRP